jgi:hypothetical protein
MEITRRNILWYKQCENGEEDGWYLSTRNTNRGLCSHFSVVQTGRGLFRIMHIAILSYLPHAHRLPYARFEHHYRHLDFRKHRGAVVDRPSLSTKRRSSHVRFKGKHHQSHLWMRGRAQIRDGGWRILMHVRLTFAKVHLEIQPTNFKAMSRDG